MDDRRQAPRVRLLKSGTILLGKHRVPCTVRNLSETGACLEVQTTYWLPLVFEFMMPGRAIRACKVVWLRDTRIGVQFR